MRWFASSVLQTSLIPARSSRAYPCAPPAASADPPSHEAVEFYAVGALVAVSACRQRDASAAVIKGECAVDSVLLQGRVVEQVLHFGVVFPMGDRSCSYSFSIR